MAGSVGFGDYLKAAFWQHWNLLYLFTSAGIFMLTPGLRDAVFALALAGEIVNPIEPARRGPQYPIK